MFGGPSKPPKIRTRTVVVTKTSTPDNNGTVPLGTSASRPGLPSRGSRISSASAPPTNRYNLTPTTKARTSAATQQPARRSASGPGRKRKIATPSTPQWASSDESSSEDDDAGLRKRQKNSSSIEPMAHNRSLDPDLKRRIRIPGPAEREDGVRLDSPAVGDEGEIKAKLVHGIDMTRGKWEKDFKPAFPGCAKNPIVHLKYPSNTPPESFELVVPHDDTNFNPINDICFSIEEILQHYLPPEIAAEHLSETDGTVRLLKRAVTKNNPDDFKAVLSDFNALIKTNLRDGTINKVLDATHSIPLSLTRRILAQVYQRTVSPNAHLLRRVKDKETTYGELLPPFVHTIFHQTGLDSESVFVDLGSGVGNVVLQSALQTGAESWGIEIMEKPASFALEQAAELRARAMRWNISLGAMTLLHGSFLDSPAIDAVLQRADVVLVNNKVFDLETNAMLLNKFLDLKEGCRVVSLESFGGGGASRQGVRNEQSIANLFHEERYESGTNSVSWAGESVEYFIAKKVR